MKRLIYFILPLGLFFSCSTDLNVLSDYKETAVVYGLLNQTDTAQYIKINKAFLGPGNALQIAQVYDSISYGNQLTVQMEQWTNGNKVNTIDFTKDSSIVKPAGIFSSPKQILYKSKTALNQNSQYNLIITNNATGNVITGSTSLVNNFNISRPISSNFNFTNPVLKFQIIWTPALNGKIYGATIRFYYMEEDKTTNIVTKKTLDWVFANQVSPTTLAGQQDMMIEFMGDEFYRYLQSKIPVDNNLKRYLPSSGAHLDLIFTVGAEDLNTFINVSQPSTGIIQERPQYTNLQNGYGVFSSRYIQVFNKNNNPTTLNSLSITELYTGQYTQNLFCDPSSTTCN